MKIVRITPLGNRACNRINEHGNVMLVVQEGLFDGLKAILVESLEKTWGNKDNKQVWIGWLTVQEAHWAEMPGD